MEFQNIFVEFQNIFVEFQNIFDQISKYIFVQILKYICPDFKMVSYWLGQICMKIFGEEEKKEKL